MESKLAFHDKFIRSFYDMSFYEKILKERITRTIGYLLLLMIFVGMLYNVQIFKVYNSFVDDIENFIVRDIPEFSIIDGEIKLKDENIALKAFRKNGLTIYFDYSGEYEDEFHSLNNIGLYLSRDKGYYSSITVSSVLDYSELEGITKVDMVNIIRSSKNILVYAVIAVVTTVFSVLLTSSILFLTVLILNLLTNLVVGTKLKFDEIFRIAAYITTITLSLFLILILFYIVSAFMLVIIVSMIQTMRVHMYLKPKETVE